MHIVPTTQYARFFLLQFINPQQYHFLIFSKVYSFVVKSLLMKSLRTKLFISIMIFSFLLTSCGAIVKGRARKHITEESGAIPPDLGKEKTTMVFLLYHGSYNRYMKKNVKRIYQGDYIFVKKEEFKNTDAYDDISKFRYVFGFDYIYYESTEIDFDSNYDMMKRVKKFYIHDRKTDSIYKPTITSGLWSKLQKVYLEKLNEKIVSNRS